MYFVTINLQEITSLKLKLIELCLMMPKLKWKLMNERIN